MSTQYPVGRPPGTKNGGTPLPVQMASDVDRIRDAFTQRLERQRATGDVKGAEATRSAIRLIDDVVRA